MNTWPNAPLVTLRINASTRFSSILSKMSSNSNTGFTPVACSMKANCANLRDTKNDFCWPLAAKFVQRVLSQFEHDVVLVHANSRATQPAVVVLGLLHHLFNGWGVSHNMWVFNNRDTASAPPEISS